MPLHYFDFRVKFVWYFILLGFQIFVNNEFESINRYIGEEEKKTIDSIYFSNGYNIPDNVRMYFNLLP